jgi:hypothetical protein
MELATTTTSELASGVDALYLSGRATLAPTFLEYLERARSLATDLRHPLSCPVGDLEFKIAPHGWGRYRYLLVHDVGRIGVSTSEHLPPIRVQPRAELLHAVGPAKAVPLFAQILRESCSDMSFSASRLDLFVDVQGWQLTAGHRERFVCRADAARAFEDRGAFSGFSFGSRVTKAFYGRIYDKTAEIAASGKDWWHDVWGSSYRPGEQVWRVELEIGRKGLTEFGLDMVREVLEATGDLWRYGTSEWLTFRSPTNDATKSRWPIAPEWRVVQQALLSERTLGLTRMAARRRAGSLRKLFPALAGYLAAFAVAVGTSEIEDTLVALDRQLRNDEIARHMTFPDRIRRRREEWALR